VSARGLLLLLCLALGLALPGGAAAQQPQRFGEWLCEPLIRAAEKAEGIPPGLLLAIGRAESGVQTSWGRVVWPWALNIAGESVFLQTRDEALRHARESIRTDPRRFIDLGCLQVNWQYHREWLKEPEHVLDPNWNVAYGARLLRNLAARHGSWEKAVGFYHSGNPQRQAVYLANVARNYCGADTKATALCQQRVPAASNAPVKRAVVRIYRGNKGETKGVVTTPGSGAPPKMIILR
jgi:hypothetical protein